MCDMHMPSREDAVQYEYFLEAADDIRKSGADITVTADDITALGEKNAFEFYNMHMQDLKHITILGNSDVRSGDVCMSGYGGTIECGRKIHIQRKMLCYNGNGFS